MTAAFMQLNEPDIKTGIKTLVIQGVDMIYVQPCFLASGIHLTVDIPGEIGLQKGEKETKMTVDGKTVILRYCEPIGDDDRIAQILADRVRSRMKHGMSQKVLVLDLTHGGEVLARSTRREGTA